MDKIKIKESLEQIKNKWSALVKKIEKSWDNACARHKALAWIDDYILLWLWRKPKDKYYSIQCWFRYNWTREHWELLKSAFHSYPWDQAFLTDLEEKQIDKYLAYFEKNQRMVDEQYNAIMKSLRWAKHCIHIINNDSELFHYDGEIISVPQKMNEETGEWEDAGEGEPMMTGERKVDEGPKVELWRMDTDNLVYNYDGPRVNRRNAARFINKNWLKSERFQNRGLDSELYLAKCRHLYYRIREQYTDLWWD